MKEVYFIVPAKPEGRSHSGYSLYQYGCSAFKTALDDGKNWHDEMSAAYRAMVQAIGIEQKSEPETVECDWCKDEQIKGCYVCGGTGLVSK